jgi:hypothetical protein
MDRRIRQLTTELRASPTARALPVGAAVAALTAAAGKPRLAPLSGAIASVGERRRVAEAQNLDRRLRSVRDGVTLSSLLPATEQFFGDFAIEPDFARVIAYELQSIPDTMIECGAGLTTVLVATLMKSAGRGRLYSLEHDPEYAANVQRILDQAGLAEHVEIVVAPLREQTFDGRTLSWYDVNALPMDRLNGIGLMIVDGPVQLSPWARWPAVAVFRERLADGGRVLLDDGRRRSERRVAFDWADRYPDISVQWIDSVKGTWRFVRTDGGGRGGVSSALQRAARIVNARPRGFALSAIER